MPTIYPANDWRIATFNRDSDVAKAFEKTKIPFELSKPNPLSVALYKEMRRLYPSVIIITGPVCAEVFILRNYGYMFDGATAPGRFSLPISVEPSHPVLLPIVQ